MKVLLINDDDGYLNAYIVNEFGMRHFIKDLIETGILDSSENDALQKALDNKASLEELLDLIPEDHRHPRYQITEVEDYTENSGGWYS